MVVMIAVITIFVALASAMATAYDGMNWFVFLLVLAVGFSGDAIYGEGSDFCIISSHQCQASVAAQEKADADADAREEEYCRGSHLVSQANGVDLYVTNCAVNHGYEVYFSKSGTHTMHQECHGGKIHHCDDIQDDHSNSEE